MLIRVGPTELVVAMRNVLDAGVVRRTVRVTYVHVCSAPSAMQSHLLEQPTGMRGGTVRQHGVYSFGCQLFEEVRRHGSGSHSVSNELRNIAGGIRHCSGVKPQ